MKKIKFLSLALTGTLIFSSVPVYANTQYTDSTHEVINVDAPVTEDSNSNCDVYAELGSEFKVTIPKKVTLDGSTKSGTYQVSVEGDIAGKETIKVIPDSAVTLSSKDKADVIGTIAQDKTKWTYNEILSDNKVLGNGEIDANGITAGAWNGTFNFNINLTENFINVIAKNESGEDLNASSNLIEGEQRENLLNGLVESGLVESAEEVDALIDVDSDDFDGLADTTFDVSSIAKPGDTIVIVHFNEEKQMWEHITTETVNPDGTVTGNFSSYSPVGFIIIDNTGNQTIHTEHADSDNNGFCDVCGKQGTIVYTYHKHTGGNGSGCYTSKNTSTCGKYTKSVSTTCGSCGGDGQGSYVSGYYKNCSSCGGDGYISGSSCGSEVHTISQWGSSCGCMTSARNFTYYVYDCGGYYAPGHTCVTCGAYNAPEGGHRSSCSGGGSSTCYSCGGDGETYVSGYYTNCSYCGGDGSVFSHYKCTGCSSTSSTYNQTHTKTTYSLGCGKTTETIESQYTKFD